MRPHYQPSGMRLRLVKHEQDCRVCNTLERCFGGQMDSELVQKISSLTETKGPYKQGETIYKLEYPFKSIFVIKAGSVKAETPLDNGTNHVSGFYFPGDLIGLEAIGDEFYNHDAIALVDTFVCEVPFAHFESLCASLPRLQGVMNRLLGQKVRQTNNLLTRRYLNSDKRLILFFKMLFEHRTAQELRQWCELQLPMTKVDLASYLGLRPESLSRSLRRLQHQGIIQNRGEVIVFKNVAKATKLIRNL